MSSKRWLAACTGVQARDSAQKSPDFAPTLRDSVFADARSGAVCGVANPRNSTAIAAVSRLASHPAKPLSRREETVNTFLATLSARRLRPGPFCQKGILGISPVMRRFPAASPVHLHVLCRPGCTPISKQTSQARASRSLHRTKKSRCSPACKRALTQDSKKARGRAILPGSDARRLRRHIGRANQQAEHWHQQQRSDHIQHMVLMHQHG